MATSPAFAVVGETTATDFCWEGNGDLRLLLSLLLLQKLELEVSDPLLRLLLLLLESLLGRLPLRQLLLQFLLSFNVPLHLLLVLLLSTLGELAAVGRPGHLGPARHWGEMVGGCSVTCRAWPVLHCL
jgi:hypothetical protein